MGCGYSTRYPPQSVDFAMPFLRQLQGDLQRQAGQKDSSCKTKITATRLIVKNHQIQRHYMDVTMNDGDEQIIYCCEQTEHADPNSLSHESKANSSSMDFNKVHYFLQPPTTNVSSPFDLFQNFQRVPTDHKTTLTMTDLMQSLLHHQEAVLVGLSQQPDDTVHTSCEGEDSRDDPEEEVVERDHTFYHEDDSVASPRRIPPDESYTSNENTATSGAVVPFHTEEDCSILYIDTNTNHRQQEVGNGNEMAEETKVEHQDSMQRQQEDRCDTQDSTDIFIPTTIKRKPTTSSSSSIAAMARTPLKSYSTNALTSHQYGSNTMATSLSTTGSHTLAQHQHQQQHQQKVKRKWQYFGNQKSILPSGEDQETMDGEEDEKVVGEKDEEQGRLYSVDDVSDIIS